LRDDRHRSGRKTLAQRAKSGDLEVKRQATWGMSVETSLVKQVCRMDLAADAREPACMILNAALQRRQEVTGILGA
jgi:hypothetical protein